MPDFSTRHNGTARTTDGEDLTPLCAAKYTMAMETQASNMALQVDGLIGSDLCVEVKHGEIFIRTVSVGVLFDDDKVNHKLAH